MPTVHLRSVRQKRVRIVLELATALHVLNARSIAVTGQSRTHHPLLGVRCQIQRGGSQARVVAHARITVTAHGSPGPLGVHHWAWRRALDHQEFQIDQFLLIARTQFNTVVQQVLVVGNIIYPTEAGRTKAEPDAVRCDVCLLYTSDAADER